MKITVRRADKYVPSKTVLFRSAMGFQKGREMKMEVAFHPDHLEYVRISTRDQ